MCYNVFSERGERQESHREITRWFFLCKNIGDGMGIWNEWKKQRERTRQLRAAREENEIARLRAETMLADARRGIAESVVDTGYSHGGASRTAKWAKRYTADSLSPESDIEENRKLLRERARDLAMNTPVGAAAVGSTRSNIIGSGLVPKPKIDHEFLGISEEEAQELQKRIKKEFALWAESTVCDTNDQNNFYELQQIAFTDWLRNGEEFALIRYAQALPNMPYQLRIKLVEADRICTEGSFDASYDGMDRMLPSGNRVMNGIEIDPSGKVVAYYISSTFPGEYGAIRQKWARVEKRGSKTGNPNVLHIFNAERADQYRGVPFLAPVISTIKQMTRYTEAEITAALINSIFAIFITTETGNDVGGYTGDDGEEEPEDEGEIRLGAGTTTFLKTGEKVNPVQSTHPSGPFSAFIETMALLVGAALEISPEVLLKRFGASFSASRGALNETWKSFKMRRRWFVNDFCQEVYNLWFAEAVAKGRLNAPGFFTDPLIRRAYTNATWNGPAQGSLNPLQDVQAAVGKIENGLSTHEDECAMMNGSDFDDNARTLMNENRIMRKVNGGMEDEDNPD